MGAIGFTKYLRPNGRTKFDSIERPAEICELADDLVGAGYRFECEVLTTGEVHLDCSHREGDGPLALEVVPNGPGVPEAVDRLVRTSHERARAEGRIRPKVQPWIQTYTGQAFHLLEPKPEQVKLIDIAHALALQCRYNGHSREFYSIAEHSIRVAHALRAEGESLEVQRIGLLHDAAEAYVGDLVAPIKMMPGFEAFRMLEQGIWQRAIAPKFGLPAEIPAPVKVADLCMLATEAPQVLTWPPPRDWALPAWVETYPEVRLEFLSPNSAELAFLYTCRVLGLECDSLAGDT